MAESVLDRVQMLCRKAGISIYALEKELGFGKGTIARWKNASPTVGTVTAVAAHFGVTMDWLAGSTDYAAVKGFLMVCKDGECVCGTEFTDMHRLLKLVETFAQGEPVDVVILKKGTQEAGDGASN